MDTKKTTRRNYMKYLILTIIFSILSIKSAQARYLESPIKEFNQDFQDLISLPMNAVKAGDHVKNITEGHIIDAIEDPSRTIEKVITGDDPKPYVISEVDNYIYLNGNYEVGSATKERGEEENRAKNPDNVISWQSAQEMEMGNKYDEKEIYYTYLEEMAENAPKHILDVPPDWTMMPNDKNLLHTFDEEPTVKFISPDGLNEAVFNIDTGEAASVKNQGTANLYGPDKPVRHTLTDIRLHYQYGTGRNDTTTNQEKNEKYWESIKQTLD
jgi:hypothetical protein